MKSTESLEVKDLKLPTILMTNQRLHHGNGQKNTWHGSHKQCGAVREHNHEKNGNNMMFSLFCAGTVVYGLIPKGGESRIFKRVLQQKEIEVGAGVALPRSLISRGIIGKGREEGCRDLWLNCCGFSSGIITGKE